MIGLDSTCCPGRCTGQVPPKGRLSRTPPFDFTRFAFESCESIKFDPTSLDVIGLESNCCLSGAQDRCPPKGHLPCTPPFDFTRFVVDSCESIKFDATSRDVIGLDSTCCSERCTGQVPRKGSPVPCPVSTRLDLIPLVLVLLVFGESAFESYGNGQEIRGPKYVGPPLAPIGPEAGECAPWGPNQSGPNP